MLLYCGSSPGAELLLLLSMFLAGVDLETSLLSFEKLDRASPDLWPEQRECAGEGAYMFPGGVPSHCNGMVFVSRSSRRCRVCSLL